MASKGQKYKKYSNSLKQDILREYFENGVDTSSLGKRHGIPRETIKNWITKAKRNIDVEVDHRKGGSGRPKSKNLTLEDYKERYEILKKYQAFLQARRGKK